MTTRKNTFLLKRSNVPGKVPSPGDLQLGELALNTSDVILYASGTTANSILPIGWDRIHRSGDTVTGNFVFNGNIDVTSISPVDYIDFNTTPTVPNPTGGTLYFDSNENALSYKPITNQNDVTVNLGQESLIRIYNDLPTTILNGQVLHITGATSGVPTVALANASKLGATFTDSLAQTSGVATHDIPSGQYGFMTNFGIVRDLNTTAFTVGQEVFLSDTIDGALTNDPNNIAFTSRISTVGYCLESNATTGKILVVITNENPLQSLTQQEINVLLGNTISTGAYFYTGATTASTTTINVSPMRGWIVYNTGPTYATNPLVLNIYYSGGTNLPVTGLTSSFDTYLLVNSGGTLYQTNIYPSPQERRHNIFLGRVVHPNKTTILNVEQSVDFDVSPYSSLRDLWVPIKIINEGVVPSPNGATLTFKTSSGTFWGNGIGFPTDELNPNAITVPAYLPASFYYTTQTGGTFVSTTTTVDTTNYDVGGVAVNVPGSGNYTTQRIYMSQSGVIRLQYGQEYYSTLAKAIAAIPSETFVVNPDNSIDCTLIGLLTVKDGTGDLSNTDDAIFTFVSKFGEILGGTGGISTTTLQQAYNNSINPEITTNTILGGVQFRGGTGNDADKNIIIENNSSVETAYIRADGKALFNTISATTIGGSGSCVTNLYVSNISSCSPLNIQPNNEGNVYFGSTSAITIDLSNNRLGVGVSNPRYKLDISDSGSTLTYTSSDTGGALSLSGITGIPRMEVFSPPYLSNPAVGIQMGVRSWDDSSNSSRGKTGDTFIYASTTANGLNIVNNVGSNNTEDYIRFYAGTTPASATSDIHIQGSGSTRGYVGINNDNPTYRLDILGTTGRVFYDGDTTRNRGRQSQIINEGPSTGITAISVASEGSGNQIELFSIGSGVSNSIQWRFAGEPGDVALYASGAANNLNIMNNLGSGTTDNIRFYVGGSGHITGQTPSMIIIGSGSTKGYVGIGTVAPSAKLHIYSSLPDLLWVERDSAANAHIRYKNPVSQMWAGLSPAGNFAIGNGIDLTNSSQLTVVNSSGNVGIGIDSPSAKLHVTNTGSSNSFLVEDSTNPDSSPFVIDNAGNVGIGLTGATTKLDVNGVTRHRGNVLMDPGTTLLWEDTTGVLPTSVNSKIRWTINSDSAEIYAFSPAVTTDDIDFVFKISDNATSILDNYVFWIDDFTGEASDSYPLEMRGLDFIVNPLRRYATLPANQAAGATNFNVLKLGATNLTGTILHANVTTERVGVNTSSPSETLDVNGKTKTINFQMTSGATDGYVLTSDASGNASWGNLSSLYTGNTSGNCITDLYVSNIHSCSPLNINPLDEGNVYFGSTSAITIDLSNNRVGIGIDSPTAKLHINNTTSGNTFLAEDSTNPDSSPFVIDASGQVGIGTTTPSAKLNISGNTKIDVITAGTTDGLIINKSGSFTRGQIVLTDDNNLLWRFGLTSGGGNTSFNFFNGANDVLTINRDFEQVGIGVNPGTVGTQAKLHINNTTTGATFLAEDSTNPDSTPFVIDSIGRVGIGVSNPGSKVVVYDGDTFIWGGSNVNTGLRLQYGLGTSFWITTPTGNTMSIGGIGTSAPSSGVININSVGNVGIGTISPSERLDVSGNTIVSGTLSGGTMVITTEPTSGYTTTQILMRNTTTGQVEITDSTSPSIYNYGMSYAMTTFNYLT